MDIGALNTSAWMVPGRALTQGRPSAPEVPLPVEKDPGDRLDMGGYSSVPQHDAHSAAVTAEPVPLSMADRISLDKDKKQTAQAFYQVGQELAKRVTGKADNFRYGGPGLSNIDDIASLWLLQAKHGDIGTTIKSVPATIGSMALGSLSNLPIEGARVEKGRLKEVQASGHNFNPLLNTASLVATGAALAMVPGLAPLTLALPLISIVQLATQRFGATNAPVHEMAHGMQFLLTGDLLNRGMIDESDFMAIQNDMGRTGYLWGGETEKAARAAELRSEIKPMFDVIKKRVARRLEERHSLAAAPVIEEARRVLDEHEAWMTKELSRNLPGHRPA